MRPLGCLFLGALALAASQCGGASSTELFPKDASLSEGAEGGGSSGGSSSSSGSTGSSSGGDDSSGDDASGSSGGSGSSSSGSGGSDVDGGEAGGSVDGGSSSGGSSSSSSGGSGGNADAGDGAAITACSHICAGCCDENGICQNGGSLDSCGSSGASCADCSKNRSCPLAEAPCCKGVGGCGCAVAGLVGCN